VSDRQDRIADLFERALALRPDARAPFLADACDDHGIRDEVTSLLAAHTTEPDFLDRLAADVLPSAIRALDDDLAGDVPVTDRYEVIDRLGSGGMGVVYRARDTQLGRIVALKFLPAHLTTDPDARARLEREARAASVLDHPHIAPVYEIGETADARLFIAMAFVEGETLERRIARGPLSVDQAVELACQVAYGLSAAHRRGIVHRDIKPSNLMVTPEGTARIVDFGVAKTPDVTLTRDASRLGTVAYMSPEQTRGRTADHRTDLWALGAVLYEMLTGDRPFPGDGEDAVMVGIRTAEPRPVEQVRPDAPGGLGRIVARCLSKDPGDRYDSADDLGAALRAVAEQDDEAAARAERIGLVVVPFANLSTEPENEYFSHGLTEEIITDLSSIDALRVISRTSAMRLKAAEPETRAIARELGVRYALEGSVRRSGDAVRIAVQLLDAPSGEVIWGQKFDGAVEDVFDVQEQVARSVVEALRLRLTPTEARALADRPIADVRAFESYLRARYEAYRFSKAGLDRAERYVEAALELVGDNALLYSTLGHITAMRVDAGVASGPAVLARVDALAERVLALDPDSARGRWLEAFAAFYRGDIAGAIRAGEEALRLDPEEPDALLLLGYIYVHVGRTADASVLFERALRLDPLTPLAQVMPGCAAVFDGRPDDAVAPYRRGYELEPDSPFGMFFYGWALACAGRLDDALPVLREVADRFDGSPFAALATALAYGLEGRAEEAVAAITPGLEAAARGSCMFARELAHAYALAGEPTRALDWLERAVDLGLRNHAFLAEHDPLLQAVRSQPRFQAILSHLSRVT
jgi:eukaryotic-like serine/threonine-protein kinase